VPYLRLSIPSQTQNGQTVDVMLGKAVIARVTPIDDKWLRIEPDMVCRILAATSHDGLTTLFVHQAATEK
jgi:hypothetical protein